MTAEMQIIIGACVLAAPFLVLLALMVREAGFWYVAWGLLRILGILAVFGAGTVLLVHGMASKGWLE